MSSIIRSMFEQTFLPWLWASVLISVQYRNALFWPYGYAKLGNTCFDQNTRNQCYDFGGYERNAGFLENQKYRPKI